MCEPIFPKDGHMFEKLPGGTSSYLDPQRGIRGCLSGELGIRFVGGSCQEERGTNRQVRLQLPLRKFWTDPEREAQSDDIERDRGDGKIDLLKCGWYNWRRGNEGDWLWRDGCIEKKHVQPNDGPMEP